MGLDLCTMSTKVSFGFRTLVSWSDKMTEEKREFSCFLTGQQALQQEIWTYMKAQGRAGEEVGSAVRWLGERSLITNP